MNHHVIGAIAALSFLPAVAMAQSTAVNFTAPAWRGSANTEYAGWERFATAVGANAPDDAATTANAADARAIQSTTPDFSTPPGILRTSAGNIYSGFQILNLAITNNVAQPLSLVQLQTRTSGTELNYANVALQYFNAQGQPQSLPAASRTELFRQSGVQFFPGFPSEIVESKFTWDLSGLGDSVTSLRIVLPHTVQHISIERFELDTLSIPAPGGVALSGFAAIVSLRRRAR